MNWRSQPQVEVMKMPAARVALAVPYEAALEPSGRGARQPHAGVHCVCPLRLWKRCPGHIVQDKGRITYTHHPFLLNLGQRGTATTPGPGAARAGSRGSSVCI